MSNQQASYRPTLSQGFKGEFSKHRRSSSDVSGLPLHLRPSNQHLLQKRGSVDTSTSTSTQQPPARRKSTTKGTRDDIYIQYEDDTKPSRTGKSVGFDKYDAGYQLRVYDDDEDNKGTMTDMEQSLTESEGVRFHSGSPGVPGRSSSKLSASRDSTRSEEQFMTSNNDLFLRPLSVDSAEMVDSSTQTMNDAATQTSDDSSSELDTNYTIPTEAPVVRGPRSPRSSLNTSERETSHRRSSSWDSPLVFANNGSEASKRQSLGMLNSLIKEKREAQLRELELKKERQQKLLKETLLKSQQAQIPPSLSPTPRLHSPNHSLTPTMSVTRATLSPGIKAHHHRSKSDPNVIPPMFKNMHTLPIPGLSQLSPSAMSPSPTARSPRSLTLRPKRSSPAPPTHQGSPNKQQELAMLERQLEVRHKQLMEKGIIPQNSPSANWGSGRSILEMDDNELMLSLDDIEDEIEFIRQRTMDIQGKVEMLERARCHAPDPVSMLFGLHGMGDYKQVPNAEKSPSPDIAYEYSPPPSSSFENRSNPPLKPHLEKSMMYLPEEYHYDPSEYHPIHPDGPDRTKVKNLQNIHSSRSAFSPPPRGGSSENVNMHWGMR